MSEDQYILIPIHKGRGKARKVVDYTVVSPEFAWLSKYKWSLGSDGYAIRYFRAEGVPTQVRMHRIMLGLQDPETGEQLSELHSDHINGNRLDNRVENLRACTQAENARNRALSSNNTSGIKNMSWKPDSRRLAGGYWCYRVHTGKGRSKALSGTNKHQVYLRGLALRARLHGKYFSGC